MPAFAIIKIDSRDEPARISEWPNMAPVLKFGTANHGQLEIVGATREELEIIAAMVNGIGTRVASEQRDAA